MTVTTAGSTSGTTAGDTYSYVAPQIGPAEPQLESVTPSSGPVTGGTLQAG